MDLAVFSLELCSPEDGCGRLGAETGDLGAVGMTQAGHPMAGEAGFRGGRSIFGGDQSSPKVMFVGL